MARRRLTRGLLTRALRRIRYYYLRLILIPDTPRRVAMGLGVGVFIGFLPIIPFQTVAAITLAWAFRGSLVAGAAGTWVTNPATVPVLYPVFFYIGRWLTPFGHNAQLPDGFDIKDLASFGGDVIMASLAGGVVLGLIFGPIVYFIALKYIDRLQAWERRKLRIKFALHPPPSC